MTRRSGRRCTTSSPPSRRSASSSPICARRSRPTTRTRSPPMAAGIPLLLALSAVLGTLGLLAIPSQLIPMDQNVAAVVLLIGLAVGVDYSLFYLKREREERAAGRSARAALEAAAATSGRSVLISGVTVMVAMGGLLFTGDKTFMSFGVGTMTVVGVAMLGSLPVLPA